MIHISSAKDLETVAAKGNATIRPGLLKIMVGSASCGISAGAEQVTAAAVKAVEELKLDAVVSRTGCVGFCQMEPLVDIIIPGKQRLCFGNMNESRMAKMVKEFDETGTIDAKGALYRYAGEENVPLGTVSEYPSANGYSGVIERSEHGFFSRQKRIILRNCGTIDPMSIEEAVARGAYQGLLRALSEMKPGQVVEEVLKSELRGRGGAGFPTGRKWETALRQESDEKYFIVNADEGDPGAFMDRSVMEGDPHAILEGLIIGCYAIGAYQAYIYVRSEYPLAVTTLRHAIEEAKKRGILGENIIGTDFTLNVEIRKGAGAFVCGEETALIASIEGRAGEPRPRPPFPAISGLWGKPTIINNVKTLSSIGPILSRGADWYAESGTERNRGTTVFSLVGAVKNTGLVEVPLGITLKEMVHDIGGGVIGKKDVKAVQTGGPSGGCIPAAMLDMPIDYDKLSAAGAMMGSGGMIVIDTSTCMVDLARFFLSFTAEESCGKCTPCREGTKQMLAILTRICEGKSKPDDVELLESLAATVKSTSLCGLGGTAPNPVLSMLKYFKDEFKAHVQDRKCPAGVCRNLITMSIDKEKCTGCGQCIKVCAVNAIAGEKKSAHNIQRDACTKCGACRNVCAFDAVVAS